ISEGQALTNLTTRIGCNSCSFVLESRGELPVINMGTVGPTDLTQAGTLEGGEVRAYQFTVPPGLPSLEVQLMNPTGNPAMVLRTGSFFPHPGASSTTIGAGTVGFEDYGNEGGYTILLANGDANTNQISIANPTNGIYTVMVKARSVSGLFANAS